MIPKCARSAGLFTVLVAGLLFAAGLAALGAQSVAPEDAESCREKYNLLRSGMAPGSNPINFTEKEINSWLELDLSGSYPAGVQDVYVDLQQNNALVFAKVDFDLLKLSVPNLLPELLEYLFTGTHNVRVEGTIVGRQGQAEYDISSVKLDGVPLPSFAAEMLLTRVLRRRFPGRNIESPFDLPFEIDSLSILPGRIQVLR